MKSLNRDSVLQKEKLQIVQVDLGNEECVYVRQMTGRDRDTFEQSVIKAKRNAKGEIETYETVMDNFRSKLIVMTLCDESGELILQPGDVGTLNQNMSALRIDKIVAASQKLNAISEKDKEDLVKNSGAGLAGSSSSDSAGN